MKAVLLPARRSLVTCAVVGFWLVAGTQAASGAEGDPCMGLSYEGTCKGDMAQWCENREVVQVDCSVHGDVCGWDEENGYYACIPGTASDLNDGSASEDETTGNDPAEPANVVMDESTTSPTLSPEAPTKTSTEDKTPAPLPEVNDEAIEPGCRHHGGPSSALVLILLFGYLSVRRSRLLRA